MKFSQENNPNNEPTDEGFEDDLKLTNREFLERSGVPIHLFVDSMHGPTIVRSEEAREKSVQRALKRLRELSK